ncbi:MAG: aminotransferase class I/II-fold pyridoxal phosphate-dependent enzyme [Rikenellaceae bacterium]|nr:aminotransferase class I/II-fold pyridoxal phosphate-dependent enzyme [Rikenellaceae bacterium]
MQSSKCKRICPAERVQGVSEYYFSKKLREIASMRAEGHDIISLGVGGPDRPPQAQVVERLCEESHRVDTHSYQPYVGIPELRKAFSEWYAANYGVTLDPATEIQPLIGSKEGILHTTLAFVNKGDGVLVPNPGYPTYSSVSRLAEAEVFTYDLCEERGWQPDFEALERLPLERIKLMWVNYPNMPTGARATRETMQRLVDFGRRHGIVICNDNPYSFILNDTPESLLSVEGAKDVCIEMNSLSKSHNMAGWRVGMLASNPQFIEWILRVKSNIDSGMFRPVQLAAVEALGADEEWYAELNAEYAGRRKIAEQILEALDCRFDPSQVGLFLWGRIPEKMRDGVQMSDLLLYEAGVFVTPGMVFGSNGDRYIRISLCATRERMEEALQRVKSDSIQKCLQLFRI